MPVSQKTFRLCKALLESDGFCEAIQEIAAEESHAALDAMRFSVRAGSLAEAARADAAVTIYEDLLGTLRRYAGQAERE